MFTVLFPFVLRRVGVSVGWSACGDLHSTCETEALTLSIKTGQASFSDRSAHTTSQQLGRTFVMGLVSWYCKTMNEHK